MAIENNPSSVVKQSIPSEIPARQSAAKQESQAPAAESDNFIATSLNKVGDLGRLYNAGAQKGMEFYRDAMVNAPKLKLVGYKYASSDHVYENRALGLLFAPFGCGGQTLEPVYEVDSDGVSEDPADGEMPEPVPGDSDGVGNVTNIAQGNCTNPVDLMTTGMNQYLCVSGDEAAVIETLNSDEILSELNLPNVFPGTDENPDVSVRLNAAAKADDQIFAAFSASDSAFTGVPGASQAAGIYVTDEAGSEPTVVPFEAVSAPAPLIGFELYNPNVTDSQSFVDEIHPNKTVAMQRVGDQLIVLNENRAIDLNNLDNALAYAPSTVHVYDVTGDGLVESGAPAVLIGSYLPKAMKLLPDGDLLVLTESGVDGGSSLVRLTNSSGQYAKVNEFALTDSDGSFTAADSGNDNLAIYEANGNTYALVGDTSGSGEVARINISTGETEFIGVFESDVSVTAIEIHESAAGLQAIVIAEDNVESLNLATDEVSGSPAPLGDYSSASALSGDEAVVAQPDGSYQKIPLNDPVNEGADADG